MQKISFRLVVFKQPYDEKFVFLGQNMEGFVKISGKVRIIWF